MKHNQKVVGTLAGAGRCHTLTDLFAFEGRAWRRVISNTKNTKTVTENQGNISGAERVF